MACGPGWARLRAWPPDWLSSLELKLYLRLWSLCWIRGKALEFWTQQLRQVGVMVAAIDCWTKLFTCWRASCPRLVLGSRAETRWRQAL